MIRCQDLHWGVRGNPFPAPVPPRRCLRSVVGEGHPPLGLRKGGPCRGRCPLSFPPLRLSLSLLPYPRKGRVCLWKSAARTAEKCSSGHFFKVEGAAPLSGGPKGMCRPTARSRTVWSGPGVRAGLNGPAIGAALSGPKNQPGLSDPGTGQGPPPLRARSCSPSPKLLAWASPDHLIPCSCRPPTSLYSGLRGGGDERGNM